MSGMLALAWYQKGSAQVVAASVKESLRNAILNGDFSKGIKGWSKVTVDWKAADYVTLEAVEINDRGQARNELMVKRPAGSKGFRVYDVNLIRVNPDRTYKASVLAAGEGAISIGVWEYSEEKDTLRYKSSRLEDLTPEMRLLEFEVQPGAKTTRIRTVIEFKEDMSDPGGMRSSRIRECAFLVPEAEYDAAISEPK